MRIDRKTLKREAREQLAHTRPRVTLVTLVYLLITYGVSAVVSIVSLLAGGISTYTMYHFDSSMVSIWVFLNILILLFAAVMGFGYTAYSLRVADGEATSWRDLFSGFPETGRVLLMNLALVGFYLVWMLAITGPGLFIVTLLALPAMLLGETAGMVLMVILFIVFYVVLIVVLLLVTVRYALSAYVLADDPNIGPLNAIRRSRTLLQGRNRECLCLSLSFWGWSLLAVLISICVLTAGVAITYVTKISAIYSIASIVGMFAMIPLMIWLQPYISITMGKYYRFLSPRTEGQNTTPDQLPTPQTPWRPDGEQ